MLDTCWCLMEATDKKVTTMLDIFLLNLALTDFDAEMVSGNAAEAGAELRNWELHFIGVFQRTIIVHYACTLFKLGDAPRLMDLVKFLSYFSMELLIFFLFRLCPVVVAYCRQRILI